MEHSKLHGVHQLLDSSTTNDEHTPEPNVESTTPASAIPEPETRDSVSDSVPPSDAAANVVGDATADVDRPELDVGENFATLAQQAIALLARSDDLYVRHGELVVLVEESGTYKIKPIDASWLMFRMWRDIYWFHQSPKGPPRRAHPPRDVARMILSMRTWPNVRRLDGIVVGPAMLPNGEIANETGYDSESHLFVVVANPMVVVPRDPSPEDVSTAGNSLRDVFGEFEFETPSDLGSAVGFLLSAIARRAYRGATPLVVVDANSPGSGKSVLVAMVHAIVSGELVPMFGPPRGADELRKKVTSAISRDQALLVFDNAAGILASAEIAYTITAPVYQDRLLGTNSVIEAPMNLIIALTGNNIALTDELARRTMRVRLNSTTLALGEREFERPDPIGWVLKHRPRILHAALTLLRAAVSESMPRPALSAWNSFESWSSIVRAAVVMSGFDDPIESMRRARIESDVLTPAAETIFTWIADRGVMRASDIMDTRLEPGFDDVRAAFGLLARATPGCAKAMTAESVGRVLRQYEGRSIGGYRLSSSRRKGVTYWRAEPTPCGPGSTATTATTATPSSDANGAPEVLPDPSDED